SRSVTEGIADDIQDFASGMIADFSTTAMVLRSLMSGESIRGVDPNTWLRTLWSFLAMLAATLAAFFVLRAIAARFYRRLDDGLSARLAQRASALPAKDAKPEDIRARERARERSIFYHSLAAILGALVLDVFIIIVAAAVGYGLALFVASDNTVANWSQSL